MSIVLVIRPQDMEYLRVGMEYRAQYYEYCTAAYSLHALCLLRPCFGLITFKKGRHNHGYLDPFQGETSPFWQKRVSDSSVSAAATFCLVPS
jgi:hypothetical protein